MVGSILFKSRNLKGERTDMIWMISRINQIAAERLEKL